MPPLSARPVKDPAPGQTPDAVLRVDPGHPERSALVQRMASRWAALQMPPLGTDLVDEDALDLLGSGSPNSTHPRPRPNKEGQGNETDAMMLVAAGALSAAGPAPAQDGDVAQGKYLVDTSGSATTATRRGTWGRTDRSPT